MERTKRRARTSWARARRRVLAALTDRQVQFLRLVCQVHEPTYTAIADTMGVSVGTVHGYRERLFQRFDIHSKVGLVLFAYRWGIVG
ncbi:MAG: LuxR C-terminal-related transcriptional regulator [Flavobacteriales bacterium]